MRTSTPARRLALAAFAAVTAASLAACGPTGTKAAGQPTVPAVPAGNVASPTTGDLSTATNTSQASAPASAKPAAPSSKPKKPSGGSHTGSGGGSGSGGSGGSSTGGGSGSGGSGSQVNVPSGSASQAVQDAFRQAKADGKSVLLDFGTASCFNCRTIDALYKKSSIKSEISGHYHLVVMDINANMSLLQKYDNSGSYGLPVMLVVTPQGTVRVNTNKSSLPKLSESGFLSWLQQWAD
ncbi:thioredoxin family protein [Streptacidiphilus rugosus]|uniref:thioredoxin family protein n=1 Tax=Streptacidiphilus rugosus TaxID=405783 RepID=UPI0012F79AAD|nr:thioredoxin family protein [Streptacidiphilus rugosus]